MTFESLIDNININADNNEPLSVKVSYGDELRRTTFNGGSYEALRDVVAKLFGIDQASVVLKYQDEDGDKITMSSDGELKDALQGSKDKKVLRLFVDLKAAPAPVEQAGDVEEGTFPPFFTPFAGRHFGGPFRGRGANPRGGFFGPRGGFGHHGRGGFGHHGRGGFGPHSPHDHGFPAAPPAEGPHGHPHPPPHGPHGHPHPPPHGPHGHPHPPPHGPHGFPPHHGPHGGEDFHGFGRAGPYGGPWAHKAHKKCMKENMKEHKHALKESMKEQKQAFKHQIRLMKENATTPDDFLAIKEYKKQARAEWKNKWQQQGGHHHHHHCHDEKDRYIAKHVADVTIPDNSELPRDTPVTKTWRLRNVGTTAWPEGSQLIFISRRGDNLNGPERVLVGAVEPQQEVEVSLTFITPAETGRYIGYYRMATAEGAKFGQRVWVSFIIPQTPTIGAIGSPNGDATITTTTTTTTSSPSRGVGYDVSMD